MKVSIVTVCLNSVRTIERTILSVLGQSYDDIEYVIIDGASTDGTQRIIEKYRDSIAYYVSEKDDGLYDAMNKGIERATGDYIAFLNADDWYEEGVLERVMDYAAKHDADILCGDIYYYERGIVSRRPKKHFMLDERVFYEIPCCHQSIFSKRELFLRYGGFDTKYHIAADHAWLMRMYQHHVTMTWMPYVITNFSAGGISSDWLNCNKEKLSSAVEMCHAMQREAADTEELAYYLDLEQSVRKYYLECEQILLAKEMIRKGLSVQQRQEVSVFLDSSVAYTIFGCGTVGMESLSLLEQMGCRVPCFCDNDKDKWGKHIKDKKICAPGEILTRMKAAKTEEQRIMIAISADCEQEVAEQLVRQGLCENSDFLRYSEIRKGIGKLLEEEMAGKGG